MERPTGEGGNPGATEKPGAPAEGGKLPDHMAHLSADDLAHVRIAEQTLGDLSSPDKAKTVAAIVKAHNHGEGRLFDRSVVEGMSMDELKNTFGRRYP
ncbi:MAG TPA: hypothetical protein PK765_01465 [bacterium]|nr:hypothetical protein [bacterium]